MTANDILENSLRNGDISQVIDLMRSGEFFTKHYGRKDALQFLKENRKADYYIILGCMYDVSVYEVDGNAGSEGCAEEDFGKFFASTLANDFPGEAAKIPLGDTVRECFRSACDILRLEQQFEAECKAGEDLPRIVRGTELSLHLADIRASGKALSSQAGEASVPKKGVVHYLKVFAKDIANLR